jgi:hypothetical protein
MKNLVITTKLVDGFSILFKRQDIRRTECRLRKWLDLWFLFWWKVGGPFRSFDLALGGGLLGVNMFDRVSYRDLGGLWFI